MEISHTRRRESDPKKSNKEPKFTLYDQTYLISLLRSKSFMLGDSLSISLRVAILSDLAFAKIIETVNNKIVIKEMLSTDDINEIHKKRTMLDTDSILEKAVQLISKKPYGIKELLLALNGESYTKGRYHLHFKNLRSLISKKLECKGMIRYEKRTNFGLFKGKASINHKINIEMREEIMECLEGKSNSLRGDVLVACLSYCDAIDDLLFSIEPKKALRYKHNVTLIKAKYVKKTEGKTEPEQTIHDLLHALHTL